MTITPTVNDILDLAQAIGVPLPDWVKAMEDWSSLLHELAHWAVKPRGYLEVYLEAIQPYGSFLPLNSTPDAEAVMALTQQPTIRWANGYQRQLQADHVMVYQLDPTPDEFGARAWGLQVLERMNWVNPLACEDLQAKYQAGLGAAQFDWAELTNPERHIISNYGPEQLDFMGIDVAAGIWRPQVEVTFDGRWIRTWWGDDLVWQWDIFEGGEVVAWDAPQQAPRLMTMENIEALCAMAGQAS
jgi:hypothetical protein